MDESVMYKEGAGKKWSFLEVAGVGLDSEDSRDLLKKDYDDFSQQL